MTGEMLVYFCTVIKQGPVGVTKKITQYKENNQTVNSNYFYYHIVILQLYSEIVFRIKKTLSVCICFVFPSKLILHLSERTP